MTTLAVRLHSGAIMKVAVADSHRELFPPAGMALRAEVLARQYYALFNERRLDEAERLVDPQAIFNYPAAREHLIGRAGYRELTRRWLEAFPDARALVLAVHVGADAGSEQIARTEWLGEGTHLGVLQLPGFPPIPPTGRFARLPMSETIRIERGLVASTRMEFDPAELRRALGF